MKLQRSPYYRDRISCLSQPSWLLSSIEDLKITFIFSLRIQSDLSNFVPIPAVRGYNILQRYTDRWKRDINSKERKMAIRKRSKFPSLKKILGIDYSLSSFEENSIKKLDFYNDPPPLPLSIFSLSINVKW